MKLHATVNATSEHMEINATASTHFMVKTVPSAKSGNAKMTVSSIQTRVAVIVPSGQGGSLVKVSICCLYSVHKFHVIVYLNMEG